MDQTAQQASGSVTITTQPTRHPTLILRQPHPGGDEGAEVVVRDDNEAQAVEEDGTRVTWAHGTVDNEGMGRKSSKKCCVYHKPRAFGESSSYDESSYYSKGSNSSDEAAKARHRRRRRKTGHKRQDRMRPPRPPPHGPSCEHGHGHHGGDHGDHGGSHHGAGTAPAS